MPRWKRVCRWMGRSAGEQGQGAVMRCIPNAAYHVDVPAHNPGASACLLPVVHCILQPQRADGRVYPHPCAVAVSAACSKEADGCSTAARGAILQLCGCKQNHHLQQPLKHLACCALALHRPPQPAPVQLRACAVSRTPRQQPPAAPHLACRALPQGRPSQCRRCPGRSPSRQR